MNRRQTERTLTSRIEVHRFSFHELFRASGIFGAIVFSIVAIWQLSRDRSPQFGSAKPLSADTGSRNSGTRVSSFPELATPNQIFISEMQVVMGNIESQLMIANAPVRCGCSD